MSRSQVLSETGLHEAGNAPFAPRSRPRGIQLLSLPQASTCGKQARVNSCSAFKSEIFAPSILADHPRSHQPFQGPQDALRGGVGHPLEPDEVVDAQRLELQDRRGQVGADHLRRRRGRHGAGRERGLGVESEADARGRSTGAAGALGRAGPRCRDGDEARER